MHRPHSLVWGLCPPGICTFEQARGVRVAPSCDSPLSCPLSNVLTARTLAPHHQDLKKSQKYFRRGLESVAAAADATVLMRLHWARYQALLADKKQRFPEPTPER